MLKAVVTIQFGLGAVVSIGAATALWGLPGAVFSFGISQMLCALILLTDKK